MDSSGLREREYLKMPRSLGISRECGKSKALLSSEVIWVKGKMLLVSAGIDFVDSCLLKWLRRATVFLVPRSSFLSLPAEPDKCSQFLYLCWDQNSPNPPTPPRWENSPPVFKDGATVTLKKNSFWLSSRQGCLVLGRCWSGSWDLKTNCHVSPGLKTVLPIGAAVRLWKACPYSWSAFSQNPRNPLQSHSC